jgi:hypothetical protein
MESREVQALEARLAAVERRFRTATMVWVGVVIAVIALSVGAQRAFSQTQTLQTRELDIVDASGRTRIALALSTNGNPGLWVYDANGKTRAYLGLSGSGTPTPQLSLSDENERTRAYLGFGTVGESTPQMDLSDPQGNQRLYVGWNTAEKPWFSVSDESGKTMWSAP